MKEGVKTTSFISDYFAVYLFWFKIHRIAATALNRIFIIYGIHHSIQLATWS
jgi:hypothetical protein